MIIRKNSSKNLLAEKNSQQMPNIPTGNGQQIRGKSTPARIHNQMGSQNPLALKTETKAEDLFTDQSNASNLKNSNQKKVQHNYVKIQNSEISSQGTAENTNAMF